VLLVCLFSSAAFGQPWDGNGVEGDPYLIYDACDMQAIGANYRYWRAHFRLMSDIDLGEYTGTNFNIIGREIIALPTSIALDTSSGKMYWTDPGTAKIQRAHLDGSGIEDLVTSGLSHPRSIALDVTGSKMYWTDAGTDKIQRANFDGTGVEDLVTTGLSSPHSIALDITGGKMYWTDAGTDKIQRANLDGTGVEDLVTTGLSVPHGIALDVSAGKMYWTDPGTEKIQRANLDGSGVEDLVTTGLGYPYGITLDVAGSKMYWVDSGSDKIQRANFEGTGVEDVIETGLISPYGIALDLASGMIYWTDSGTRRIQRANLDGTEIEDLVASHFRGVFDGNGHTISNFTYDSNGVHRIGLFGYVSDPNAEIRDLRLVDPNIDGGTGKYVGPLVGHLVRGTVTDCRVDGGCVSGGRCVGGLAGLNYDRISDCNASVNLTGQQQVGGMVGGSEGVISNCRSSSIVTAVYSSGGLVGSNTGNIYGSNSTGSVDGGFYVGGLVGENYTTGTISNSYSAGSVSGSYYVGGLVGLNGGDISSCYSTNTVSGVMEEIGGLVGRNEEGEIWNCYSKGDISGFADVGGFLGRNYEGFVSNCYSTGSASAVHNTGGLVSSDIGGTVIDCFWDVNSSGLDTSDGGIGKTTSEMQTESTFTDAGWDFVGEVINGPNDVWTICEGEDYPMLAWEKYGGGNGTEANPYLIRTSCQMNAIGADSNDWDKHFKLMADIDLSAYTGTSFNIIGSSSNPFTGVFDGNDHEILNLKYESVASVDYFGMFGFIEGNNAEIRNLGLAGADVNLPNGGDFGGVGVLVGRLKRGTVSQCYASDCRVRARELVGSLVGSNYGVIERCYSSAEVLGGNDESVGALVGVNYGQITKSYALGSVSGVIDVGGLVGNNFAGGSITDCYSSANVTATCCYVGGLVSGNRGTVQRCYSVGTVSGDRRGGLVSHNHGTITSCFWDSQSSDCNVSEGGVGLPTAQMQTESTFTDAGWDFVGEVINGPNDIWDICEGTNYPKFVWQIPAADFVCPDGVNFIDYAFFAEHWLQSIYGECGGVELTSDGKVNWVDFALFAEYWMLTGCGECGGADFTGDENVDLADLYVFATYWLGFEYAEVDLTNDGQVGLDDLREFTENWLAGL